VTAQPAPAGASPWPARRRRAGQLRERYPFAAEVLTLYLALLEVQEPAGEEAAARPPEPEAVLRTAAGELLPRVVEATVAAGPRRLAESAVARFHAADHRELVARWLRGAEQPLVDRYLARAVTAPLLEAVSPEALAVLCPGPREARRCPRCGGTPQLSFFAPSDDPMVTGPRHLLCARCGGSWVHPRMVCAACGEETSARLPVYSEAERLPHLRIDSCETCRRYLVGIDPRRDAAAVPVVDELAALPLDLYARERGLSKVTPNLMGM
jgi:ribosomal protein L37E